MGAIKPIPDVISCASILEITKGLEEKDRALAFTIYLTGARISEALELKQQNFIMYTKDGETRWKVNLKTLKNRKRFVRVIPLIVRTPEEKIMFGYLDDYYSQFEPAQRFWMDSRNAITNRFKRVRFTANLSDPVRKTYTTGEYSLHPHYLRHCRLTHLAERFNLTDQELVAYAGWTDSRPASTYVKLKLDRLA